MENEENKDGLGLQIYILSGTEENLPTGKVYANKRAKKNIFDVICRNQNSIHKIMQIPILSGYDSQNMTPPQKKKYSV